jgi:hypothetical protein
MNSITDSAPDQNIRLENFVADLTSSAYSIVLRRGLSGSWLKAELSLWRVLEDTVKKWARQRPAIQSPHVLEVWRADLMRDLTENAFHVALTNGITDSLLELEFCLYRAIRLVTRRYSRVRKSD